MPTPENPISLELLRRELGRLQSENVILKAGGGGGTSDGMLERVAKLEATVGAVQRDVGDLRNDMKDVRDRMAKLEVKVDHLPSKGFIVTVTLSTFTILAALILLQDRIGTLFTP